MKSAQSTCNSISVRRPHRSGFLVIEVLITLLLMTAVAVMIPMMLRGVYQQRQSERFLRHAQIELSNVSTRLHASEFVSQQSDAANIELSHWFVAQHPETTLSVQENQDASSGLVAAQLEISRPNGDQRPQLTQRLTIWITTTDDAATAEAPVE